MIKIWHWLNVEPENQKLLKASYFAFFTSGVMSILLGTLMPYIIAENKFNYAQSGMILSAHQIGNFFAILGAGFLPYIVGRKRSTLILGAGTALGLALIPFSYGLPLFFLAFAFTGIGRGTMSNICNAVTSESAGNKTGAINLLHAVFATGALLSPLIVFFFTGQRDELWRGAALTVAILSVAAWFSLSRCGITSKKDTGDGTNSFGFLKDANLWLGTMILFFYLCAEASIIGWFVIYFKETGVLPAIAAEFTPSLLWLAIMLGRLLCAVVSRRMDKAKLILILSVGVTVCFAGMLLTRTAWSSVLFLIGIGFSMGGIYPTTFSTIRGTSSSLTTGFVISAASVGAIVMPGIVGTVADLYGLYGGIATILAALAVMLILATVKLFLKSEK